MFDALSRLPDDCIVYYEPVVARRHPDFIVIIPDLGVLTIEVKGWHLKNIQGGDAHEIRVFGDGGRLAVHKHPIQQARDYKFQLMDACRTSISAQCLVHKDGKQQGRFLFPFGHMALLTNITRTQLEQTEDSMGDLLFPASSVATREMLIQWRDSPPSSEELKIQLRGFFNPHWPIVPLNAEQTKVLRWIIHPEILLFPPPLPTQNTVQSVAVLDTHQEANVRSIGTGHRIIYGVAGSGKTILLTARARLLSTQNPNLRILLVCYNVPLASALKHRLRDCPGVEVQNFHALANDHGCVMPFDSKDDTDLSLGHRLLQKLQNGGQNLTRYDTILIDEAQDFPPIWFQCLLALLKDPREGDLVIVADGSQSLYSRSDVSWKQLGIKARGRSYNARFDLDKNYRNTKEILTLAALFSSEGAKEPEDGIGSPKVNPATARRASGILPRVLRCKSRQAELSSALEVIRSLLNGKWFDRSIPALQPQEIGVLYPRLLTNDRPAFLHFQKQLQEFCPMMWLSDRDNWANRSKVSCPTLKIQTIHHSKGLQYKAVIVMFADLLPAPWIDSEEQKETKLMFVGLTRAEDYLAITSTGESKFVMRIAESGAALLG